MTFLDRLALSIQRHEGWYPGSVSFRQNNPGNLRYRKYHKDLYKAKIGDYNFAYFPNYKIGFTALKDDLRAKICGKSKHINYSKNPTFLDMIKVYAPKEDHNDPNSYCQSLIRQLHDYNLNESTPLSEMAKLINVGPLQLDSEENQRVTHLKIKTARRRYRRALQRGLVLIANAMLRLENRLMNL